MKKVILSILVCVSVFAMSSCDKEKTIQSDDLPAKAITFLSSNFSSLNVTHAKKEKDGVFGREYTAYLSNGTSVSFDKDGDWTEVDGGNNPIPTGFIVQAIVSYVSTTYPNTPITGIEKDKTTYEVDLINNLDLVFNHNGDFLRVD